MSRDCPSPPRCVFSQNQFYLCFKDFYACDSNVWIDKESAKNLDELLTYLSFLLFFFWNLNLSKGWILMDTMICLDFCGLRWVINCLESWLVLKNCHDCLYDERYMYRTLWHPEVLFHFPMLFAIFFSLLSSSIIRHEL